MSEFDFLDGIGQAKGKPSVAPPNSLQAIFERYGNIFVEKTKSNLVAGLKRNNPNSDPTTGTLYPSIAFDVEIVGSIFRFTINMEDYWINVNDGRKPNSIPPPVTPIIKWLQHKPTVANSFSLTRKKLKDVKITTFKGLSVKVPLLSAAFAISKSIGKKGIAPTNFFTDVITPEAVQLLKKDISKVIGKSIEINIMLDVNNNTRT
jgi:hypothetical protein